VNILSFSQLARLYKISYHRKDDCFVVHAGEYDIVFAKVDGQYCSNILDWEPRRHNVFHVVSEREQLYSQKELERARTARLFQKNAGCLSYERAVRMIVGGQIEGMTLRKEDLDIAYDIYGPVVQEVRGKLKKRKVRSRAGVLLEKVCDDKCQNLAMDIFYVGKFKFLLSVMLPMGLCLVNKLDTRSTDSVLQMLNCQLEIIRNRGYTIERITTDSESAFKSIENKFPGIHLNIGGAGDHVPNADVRIKNLKEICRSVISGLKWYVPDIIIEYLVRFAVSRYNLQQVNVNEDCPRVKFTRWRPKFHKELNLCFGDYAEVYNPSCISNNALQSRSEPCIALCPSGNTHGSWLFLNLNSNKIINRSNWKRMFTNDWIIEKMNSFAGSNIVIKDSDNSVESSFDTEIAIAKVENNSNLDNNCEIYLNSADSESLESSIINENIQNEDEILLKDLVEFNFNDDDNILLTDLVDKENLDLVLEIDSLPVNSISENVVLRRTTRTNASKPAGHYDEDKYMKSVFHISLKNGIEKYKDLAINGINSEFQQMIDKKVWSYVLSHYGSYLRSSMFLKEKMDMDGVVYKVKARLVADGSTQVLQPYEFTFTPTIKSSSISCLLKIAANEKRIVRCIDITGAYLHADMNTDVYMNLNKQLVEHLVNIDKSCKNYIRPNGSVMVKLNKALYGCKTSGFLWYNRLTNYLKKLKFVQNPADECVFNIFRNGCQLSVGLHVDDLLITTALEENYTWFANMLKQEFNEITEQVENKITYLGMHIETVKNGLKVSMPNMVKDILLGVTGIATTPATENVFSNDESPMLNETDKDLYHRLSAQLLYLAGSVRKDLLLAVSSLCTRVCKPNETDMLKLQRVLRYLNATKDRFIFISDSPITNISAMIDASFAAHEDGKSHTGEVVFVGDMVVLAKSAKQKIVTKDSTEAELVGMADKMLDVICIAEFLKEQGLDLEIPTILQDNKSTIQWVDSASKKLRNKYMLVRQELVKQGIKNGDFKIDYLKTTDMVADILTKPLNGNLFKRLRECLSGANYSDRLSGVTLE
jgi:hypothetical protein